MGMVDLDLDLRLGFASSFLVWSPWVFVFVFFSFFKTSKQDRVIGVFRFWVTLPVLSTLGLGV